MMSPQPADPVPFDRPTCYRIQVQGKIGDRWLDRLEGMAVNITTPEAGPTVTSLEGELQDQAALVGVLNTLYELHLSVIVVERLPTI